jgi:hypothetical protein
MEPAQSPLKIGGLRNPVGTDSVTVKEPGSNVTNFSPPSPRVNEDGCGLLPVTVMENIVPGQSSPQFLTMVKVPVIGGVGVAGLLSLLSNYLPNVLVIVHVAA